MFMNVREFSHLEKISDNFSAVGSELMAALAGHQPVRDALGVEMMMDPPSNQWVWDNGINRETFGYDLRDGGYSMFGIYKKDRVLTERGERAVFSETLKLLEEVEGLQYAAFAALSPGAHLGLHTHNRRHFICHFLMNDLIGGGCEILCDGHSRTLQKAGDLAIFDYSLPHEIYNHANNTRINLIIDFRP